MPDLLGVTGCKALYIDLDVDVVMPGDQKERFPGNGAEAGA